MMDESGLELSLGLSFGGSSSKSKVKDAASDPKSDDRNADKLTGSNMTISDDSFKDFFMSGPENHDPKGKQKTDHIAYKQESFFTDLSKNSSPIADCSNDVRSKSQLAKYQDLWMPSNRSIDTEEEKLGSGSSKRKLPFEEINFQNKHDKLTNYVDKHGKNLTEVPSMRNSHVSITTEDGSTGVNEDATESGAGGLNSWLGLQRENKAKCSETFNFNGKNVLSGSSSIGLQGQKNPCLLGKEPNSDIGKVAFGVPLLLQPLPAMTGPYPVSAMVPSTSSGPNAACIPSTGILQQMPNVNGERPLVPANINNMQLAFNHPSVPLPTLEKSSSWAFNSQPVHIPSFSGRKQSAGVQNREHFEDSVKTSQGSATHNATGHLPYDGKSSELTIGIAKYAGEAGVSSQSDGSKSRNTALMANEALSKPAMEGFSREKPDIRPGVAPYLEFGGYGSYPDLPWVSTTGQGPNGKTISGVTYKYNQNEIKVVCACHGIHMSQEEFVHHAGGDNSLNSQNNSTS